MGWTGFDCLREDYSSAQRDNCLKLRWNQVIGNTNNSVVSLEDNAQIQANMNSVFALLGEDVQEEASYEAEMLVAA